MRHRCFRPCPLPTTPCQPTANRSHQSTVPTAPFDFFLPHSILPPCLSFLIQTVARSSPLPINIVADLADTSPSLASRPRSHLVSVDEALSTLSPLAARLRRHLPYPLTLFSFPLSLCNDFLHPSRRRSRRRESVSSVPAVLLAACAVDDLFHVVPRQ